MNTYFISILFSFLLLFSGCSNAQQGYSTKNKRAIKLYEEARRAPGESIDRQTGRPDYKKGIELLEKAIDKDEDFLEAYQLLGEFNKLIGNTEESVKYFKKSLEINPRANLNGILYFDIAEMQLYNGDYEDAGKYLDLLLDRQHAGISKELYWAAEAMKESVDFANEALNNPSDINPLNIGTGINTKHPEYFPTLTVDGKTLLFTREIPNNDNTPRGQEDFFVSRLSEKNIWGKAEPMPKNINTSRNEGAPTLSADGRTLIFVACTDQAGDYGPGREGYGSCDLFVTYKVGSKWTNPINLPGDLNTYAWESQPALSSDGKTLYFIRRVGRRGTQRSDIFFSTLQEDGTWSKAKPLPENINTNRMETSVHIHPDGKTLYFSSDGHVGLGGQDIFMTQRQPDGSWSNPKNLGYPINTKNDENSLLVGPDGDIAFFASNRAGGHGKLDIYYFELPEEYRPTKTTYFEGLVFDVVTNAPLGGNFELIDLETGKVVIQAKADKVTGEFLVALPTDKEYALNVSFPGYAFFSKNFNMKVDDELEAFHMDVPLIPTESEGKITLANVFFDLNKATLREESFTELNKLYGFLKENEKINIEISGHTDSRGDAKANQTLSENRAKSVYQYLIDKGIKESRLTYKGYGSSEPIFSDTEIAAMETEKAKERAHQENRRTEYRILK